jgi:formylglycine-generating enzyme required for sulfatase activity
MAIVVRVGELIGFPDSPPASDDDMSVGDDDMIVELTDDPAVLGKMWGMILLLAIRDHATSVHYHPWREDGGLAYVVANVRHVLEPPPAELSGAVIAAARSLFAPAARGGLLARLGWCRRAEPACSSVELDVWGNVLVWDAIVWSSGERAGVELFRVAPAVPEPKHAKPGAPKLKYGPLGMKFVLLPKAWFYMGGGGGCGMARKKTEIKEDFEIAIHTVTQGQWQEVMGNNPSWFSRDGEGKDQVKDIKDEDLKHFPVEMVSWNDAQGFIKKLNKKEKGKGYAYRLPSEAEWDYAYRGGATSLEECSYHFYFAEPTNDLSSRESNFDGKSDPYTDMGPNLGRTAKVGSYAPNKVGLYDMHGNVTQWCADSVAVTDFDIAALGSEVALEEPFRVTGGSSWDGGAFGNLEHTVHRGAQRNFLGFRLVRVAVG